MSFEKLQENESAERTSSEIDLRFFRHDQKENDKTKSDDEVFLTREGRLHAKEQARDNELDQSVAFGSPKVRTRQTAGYIMAGASENITGEESFAELKEKIDGDLRVGSKIIVDPRLDFSIGQSEQYGKAAMNAFKEGRYLKFIVEESDHLAEETEESGASTYKRQAQAIASIIQKYLNVAPRWNDIVTKGEKTYRPELKRFFGTHQGVQEAFLAKVIEKTKGIEERDRFVKVLRDQGFDFSEGMEIKIKTGEDHIQKIHITYRRESENPEESFVFDEDIQPDLIAEIAEAESVGV